MEKIDYNQLYRLQDRVLTAVATVETGFYLTGGTCLHRFYTERRYSDDLDFFNNENRQFRADLRRIEAALHDAGIAFDAIVDERDFVRYIVTDSLKVDLVNDRTSHVGDTIIRPDSIVIDNLDNLAANKISAILGRDDPKDVFDLFVIYKEYSPQWKAVLDAASDKCVVEPEVLEYRLRSFPLDLLELLSVTDSAYIDLVRDGYSSMVNTILDSGSW